MKIHVVVPFFNCPWIGRACESLRAQTRQPDRVALIDDASDQRFDPPRWPGWAYWRNDTNRKMPRNLRTARALLAADPDDVLVILDGDDYLLPHALETIAAVYADPDAWLSWGSYVRDGEWAGYMPNPAADYPPHVHAARSYRRHPVACFNHPLSFRTHLWDRVDDADLRDDDGRWFCSSYDAVIMFPMLEMAGPRHSRFNPEVVYVYNEGNPLSEAKSMPEDNGRVHAIVRGRRPYAPVD